MRIGTELIPVRAGPLTALVDGVDLRYVAHDGHELMRRIYAAVRDLAWRTVGATVLERDVQSSPDSFAMRAVLEYREGEIAFDATIDVRGTADGVIEYVIDGCALQPFAFAKIGLNLHHPIAGLVGRRWSGTSAEGPVEGLLPTHVAPQIHLREDGWDLPVFVPVTDLRLEHDAGTIALDFDGDPYEMEDQRNWSDQSLKTYSMPAQIGYSHRARAGETVRQRVRMSFAPAARMPSRARASVGPPQSSDATLELGEPLTAVMPPIGVSHRGVLGADTARQLALVRPAHVRLEVATGDADQVRELAASLSACAEIGVEAELALFLDDDPRPALARIARQLTTRLARVLVFRRDEDATPGVWIDLAREALGVDVPVGGGSYLNFAELNRNVPALGSFDAVCWAVCPQLHAFDDLSLVENLEGQAEQVRSARRFAGTKHLAVGPITLEPRERPFATPDPRQSSAVGAAWTLGSIKQLAEAGADSLTYYETSGQRGVLGFPVADVLAAASALRGGTLVRCESAEEPWLSAVAVRTASAITVLAANLCAIPRTVTVAPGGTTVGLDPYAFARVEIVDQQ
jgi:hypothetical protein